MTRDKMIRYKPGFYSFFDFLLGKGMKAIQLSGFSGALLLLAASAGAAEAPTVEAVLDNGMKVVIRPDDRAPVAVSQVWYRVGGIDEIGTLTGISHALEHIMFKGTRSVGPGEFARRVAARGGQDNAFTNRDYTAYYQQIGSAALPEMFRLEADRMANLVIDADTLKNELEVIREERRMRTDDSPAAVLMEKVRATAFKGPARQPVIGWADDIPRIDRGVLNDWYQRFYAPNNATLVVVGGVDPAQVLAAARDTFGKLPRRDVRRPEAPVEPPMQDGPHRFVVEQPSQLPYLVMAWRAPKLNKLDDADPYALSMLAATLDGIDASRLPKRVVREARIADSINVDYNPASRGDTLFTITAVPAAGKTVADVEKAIRTELTRLARDGVSQGELKRIRRQMMASRIYQRDSQFAQAMNIGVLETRGFGWKAEDEMDARLNKVTSADIQRVARTWLRDSALTVGVLKPLPPDPKHPLPAQNLKGDGNVH